VKHIIAKAGFVTGVIVFSSLLLVSCSGSPAGKKQQSNKQAVEMEETETLPFALPSPEEALPVSSFGEIWAYVVAGREAALVKNLPLSDIGYFGAEIDSYGKLTDIPKRQNLSFPGRVHMVVACNSRSLTHFVLMPGSSERKALIADLLAAAKNYDGLQIDFEYIPARDGEAFLSFLRDLRAGLGNKVFSIALPARTRKLADDVYDYEKIKPIVDRILVMAYDEHWSGSKPGSVASLQWCRRVAEYSVQAIGSEKLIMGLPFYGRAWGNYSPSRALIFTTTDGIIKEMKVAEIRRENGVPTFDYDVNVSIKVYYEDEYSLSARMEMYKSMKVASIGFWRLGQETPAGWKVLKLEK
jgi:spore germination protein YaaH